MRKGRFPPFGTVLTDFELWEAFMRQFLAIFDFGWSRQKMRKGRFPPFGFVFAELELWEAFMRQFLAFFDFGWFSILCKSSVLLLWDARRNLRKSENSSVKMELPQISILSKSILQEKIVFLRALNQECPCKNWVMKYSFSNLRLYLCDWIDKNLQPLSQNSTIELLFNNRFWALFITFSPWDPIFLLGPPGGRASCFPALFLPFTGK